MTRRSHGGAVGGPAGPAARARRPAGWRLGGRRPVGPTTGYPSHRDRSPTGPDRAGAGRDAVDQPLRMPRRASSVSPRSPSRTARPAGLPPRMRLIDRLPEVAAERARQGPMSSATFRNSSSLATQ